MINRPSSDSIGWLPPGPDDNGQPPVAQRHAFVCAEPYPAHRAAVRYLIRQVMDFGRFNGPAAQAEIPAIPHI